MKKVKLAMLATAALMFTSQATAQDDLIGYLVDACETELTTFCSTVTPGEGRLLHCAAAHADQLSGQCEYALYQAATLLEQFAAATAYVINSCRTDIETHCSSVAMGEGRVLMCLQENAAEVSNACNQAVADTVGE